MAESLKDNIITLPNAHLRQRSKKVGVVSEEIERIVQLMQDSTIDWEASRDHEVGVALAAVQIDKLYRIVVIRNNFDDKSDHEFQVFINPEITKLEGKFVEDFEGCLSVPNVYGKVRRYSKVKVKAMSLDGKQFRITAEDFLARVFQHEIDHTNGILFIDHIKDDEQAYYRLNDEGKLEQLDYDTEIKNNHILWQ
jgi:peptide deformylase